MFSLGTRAKDITFNTRWWNSTARTVGTTSMTIDCQDVAELIGGSSSPTLTDEGPTLGYYFVRGVNDVRDMPMAVKGTVHLVLCDGLTAADLPQGVKQVVLSFDGDTTPIGSMPQVDAETANDGWYAVSGQRLGVQPTKKGLYIHGGKKVIVK